MPLEMNALNGFLRLGPQVYPARPDAVQIIERGPHGKRLAQDPVLTRLAKGSRGSGFRFWVEEMNIPANEVWNPPQRVVGLMGLGAGAGSAYGRMVAALRKRGIGYGGKVGDICELPNSDYPTFNKVAVEVFPDRESVRAGIREVGQLVSVVDQGDKQNAWRVQALLCLVREAGAFHGYPSKADRSAAIKEMNRLGSLLIIKSGEVREDGKPMISPKAVDYKTGEVKKDPRTHWTDWYGESLQERTQEVFGGKGPGLCSREQLKVPVVGGMLCRGVGEPRAPFRNPVLTAVLVVGGVAVLYGLARGLGSAIGGR